MSYKEKPILFIYRYENNNFVLQSVIDDYESCSFQYNKFQAGEFTVEINFNIPNSQKFEKNLFIQFGKDSSNFGIIQNIKDGIGEDGKKSQKRTITGFDCRYLLKRRIIKNLNNNDTFTFTGSGESCIRTLIQSECQEEKRRLPIVNNIPAETIGKEYTISEAYSNLYDVCVTIATQTEIGWSVDFINKQLVLNFYAGEDKSEFVKFSTDYDSLRNGEFEDSLDSYCNAVYVGGKGQGSNRDIYEGETTNGELEPFGLNRFESWDDKSNLNFDEEYKNEADSVLNQYTQTLSLSGNGLAKNPYIFKENYNVGDTITVDFNDKKAKVQIVSVTEHWAWNQYDIQFEFGKPLQSLNNQLSTLLKKIQTATATTGANTTSSLKWYNLPTENEMTLAECTTNLIGFVGNIGSGATFKIYFDSESKTGAKTYHCYLKQVTGNGKLTLTTGVSGATNLELSSGTYVAIIYVDENGNISKVTGTSDYSELTNKPTIPTNTSELTNDANFQNNSQVQNAITTALQSYESSPYKVKKFTYINLCDESDSNMYPIVWKTREHCNIEVRTDDRRDIHPWNQNRLNGWISSYGLSDASKSYLLKYTKYDINETNICCLHRGNISGAIALYLRGGSSYWIYADFPFTLYKSNVTIERETYLAPIQSPTQTGIGEELWVNFIGRGEGIYSNLNFNTL